MCVGSKNDSHTLELSRRPLSPCKVWGIEQRAPAVGAKYSVCMFVCHATGHHHHRDHYHYLGQERYISALFDYYAPPLG